MMSAFVEVYDIYTFCVLFKEKSCKNKKNMEPRDFCSVSY